MFLWRTKRQWKKIFVSFIIGAIIGSGFGIAGMGSAIAATIPGGLLAAYLMYLWTRPKVKQD